MASESPRANASGETFDACATLPQLESPRAPLVIPRPVLSLALGVAFEGAAFEELEPLVAVPLLLGAAPDPSVSVTENARAPALSSDEGDGAVPYERPELGGEFGVMLGLAIEVELVVPGVPDCGSKHAKVPDSSSCAVTCDSGEGFDIAEGAGGGFSSALEG